MSWEVRGIKWEVLQVRGVWGPGSSSRFPQAVTAVPLPTLENNGPRLLWNYPAGVQCHKARQCLEVSSQGHPRCSPGSGGMEPSASMCQRREQEELKSTVHRNQISPIPEDPPPDPRARACLGMVSPATSPLLCLAKLD